MSLSKRTESVFSGTAIIEEHFDCCHLSDFYDHEQESGLDWSEKTPATMHKAGLKEGKWLKPCAKPIQLP